MDLITVSVFPVLLVIVFLAVLYQFFNNISCEFQLDVFSLCRVCVKAGARRGTWPTSKWKTRRLVRSSRSRAASGCQSLKAINRSVVN